ncbi:Protein TsgA [Klebsiella pneumoniae]|nr:Protein TsgA [Klebsiella pneumoniae]
MVRSICRFILTPAFSSAIYTSIITLGSQQTRVASPKLVNFILTCGTIGTMLTFVLVNCGQQSPRTPTASMPWYS